MTDLVQTMAGEASGPEPDEQSPQPAEQFAAIQAATRLERASARAGVPLRVDRATVRGRRMVHIITTPERGEQLAAILEERAR